MKICAYINFKGKAREAAAFYGEIFKVEPNCWTYADMPPSEDCVVTDEMKPMLMHGELLIDKDQSILFFDDARPGEGLLGNAISLMLAFDDRAEQRRIFDALSVGGKVVTPLAKTFWSGCYGCLTDQFGITWSLNLCEEPTPD